MSWDNLLHWLGGFAKAAPYRLLSNEMKVARVLVIDQWAFDREWEQNLGGQNPNDPMSNHQIEEAKAWGKGARCALGVDVDFPPCYDAGHPV